MGHGIIQSIINGTWDNTEYNSWDNTEQESWDNTDHEQSLRGGGGGMLVSFKLLILWMQY